MQCRFDFVCKSDTVDVTLKGGVNEVSAEAVDDSGISTPSSRRPRDSTR